MPDVRDTKMNVAQFLLSNSSQGKESYRQTPGMQWNVLCLGREPSSEQEIRTLPSGAGKTS